MKQNAILPDRAEEFEAEVLKVRQVLAKGRSAKQLALFDLLVERSRDARSPKELEIAIALFGSSSALENNSDSRVRVYVHRLRKRLDDLYPANASSRLTIPVGEYRLNLQYDDDQSSSPDDEKGPLPFIRKNIELSIGIFLICTAILAIFIFPWLDNNPNRDPIKAVERQTLLGGAVPLSNPVIAVGDSLVLAETQDQHSVDRMILNPDVRTRDEFSAFLKANPETFYQLYDFDLNFAPVAAVEAAWMVSDRLSSKHRSSATQVQIIPVSALSKKGLDKGDIIFVGRLSQLGLLSSGHRAQSGFTMQAYNQLYDKSERRTYTATVYNATGRPPLIDYSYIAVLQNPSGHRVVMLSGLGDYGLSASVALLDSPQEISKLRQRIGTARNFEALYEVTVREGYPPQMKLITARATF